MADDQKNYDVGFGKPPVKHQFQPGNSGNPKGRPKGSRNFASVLREISDQKVKVKGQEGTQYLTKLEAMLTQIANRGAAGDLKAAREFIRLSQNLPDDPRTFLRPPPIQINFVKPRHDEPQ